MASLAKLLPDLGSMDALIAIRQYSRAPDATGGWVYTPSYLAQDVWAKVEYTKQSDEGMRGETEQIVAFNKTRFTFRDFWITINEDMRIVFEGNEYDILSINKLGRNRFLVIEAEKRDNKT
jgi:hypothetical protein